MMRALWRECARKGAQRQGADSSVLNTLTYASMEVCTPTAVLCIELWTQQRFGAVQASHMLLPP